MDNILVYSTPRTGSTLITYLCLAYLREKYPELEFLDEYFNPYHYNLFFVDKVSAGSKQTHRINSLEKTEGSYRLVPQVKNSRVVIIKDYEAEPVADLAAETERRFQILKQNPARYFFRTHASPLREDIFDYLNDNYMLYCTERRDRLDQILSYGMASHSGVWAYLRGDGKFEPQAPEQREIIFEKSLFVQTQERIEYYFAKKAQIKRKKVFVYEDFTSLRDPFDLYPSLGFSDWENYIDKDFIRTRLPFKPSFGDKRKYYKNIAEVQEWIKDAEL